MQPSPAQPSPAQPSAAQPSPAQRSPAPASARQRPAQRSPAPASAQRSAAHTLPNPNDTMRVIGPLSQLRDCRIDAVKEPLSQHYPIAFLSKRTSIKPIKQNRRYTHRPTRRGFLKELQSTTFTLSYGHTLLPHHGGILSCCIKSTKIISGEGLRPGGKYV
jgi:hypothetical protein